MWARMPDNDDSDDFDEDDDMMGFYEIAEGDQVRVDRDGAAACFDFMNLTDFEFDNVDNADYPDYADAKLVYAEYNGVPCDDEQLDWIEDNFPTEVYEELTFQLYAD